MNSDKRSPKAGAKSKEDQGTDGHAVNTAERLMGLLARKPVFRVSDKARLKPSSSATGTN